MTATVLQDTPSPRGRAPKSGSGTVRAFHLLGGRRIMKRAVHDQLDAHDMIVEGIPARSLLHLVDGVRVLSTGDVLNKAIGISIRTLQRRKADAQDTLLSPEQSSRAWRFAEILAQATDILGSQDAAETWLVEPAIGLNSRRPVDLLASAAGAEAVGTYLTRLEYGVYT
ncbi:MULTISPECIES: antitoxin Xre/MbcA/ParS toxin-binding domain-containing protein [unclassified Pannonibacter]|uniref:type II RES/Xre toxin-antitoxin system antitoxin n=1 Tax=unclassified Pannonibacter TaxID=2627228 RepID=UPI001646780C|nr:MULTISPECIES: antitoxin Xre/MbcA/ParS toxin-binding domain-containing protein [unclassified Pannonibacter]